MRNLTPSTRSKYEYTPPQKTFTPEHRGFRYKTKARYTRRKKIMRFSNACSSRRGPPTVFKFVWHVSDATLDKPPKVNACSSRRAAPAVFKSGWHVLTALWTSRALYSSYTIHFYRAWVGILKCIYNYTFYNLCPEGYFSLAWYLV